MAYQVRGPAAAPVRLSSGAVERLRRQANDVGGGGGDASEQNLCCASQSYNFELQIELANNSGAILGDWNELTRKVQGGISGHGSKGLIKAIVRGQTFSADIAVAMRDARQTVDIRAESGDLSMVSIVLRRAG
jgi:hypothetical protein